MGGDSECAWVQGKEGQKKKKGPKILEVGTLSGQLTVLSSSN